MITKVYRNPKPLKTKIMLDKAGFIVYDEKKTGHIFFYKEKILLKGIVKLFNFSSAKDHNLDHQLLWNIREGIERVLWHEMG